MLFLKNASKSLLISIIVLLILTFIITLFNYINLVNIKIVNIFSYIIPFISFFIGAFILGKKCNNKGWLEGIKFSFIILIISFLFNFLIFNNGFNIKNIIFYIIIIVSSTTGAMFGINFKRN